MSEDEAGLSLIYSLLELNSEELLLPLDEFLISSPELLFSAEALLLLLLGAFS